ncbi:MAG: type II secretion system F family protein [Deltaproteobacteria bacterium]|nr:type II secretion system F family protein [Deltaproteobacteria bacterium]
MSYFRYKLMEPTGRISSGIISLPYKDVLSAATHLERGENTSIYVKKLGPVASFLFRLLSLRLRKRVSRSFQAEFLSNISMMLRSGMTLTTALEEGVSTSESPDFESDINDMITTIQGGATFSEAADKYRYIFPKTVIYLLRMGEETGRLDEMLQDASEHLKRIQTIISDTKQALLYPSFVFIAMGAGLIFWFYYVVPKILTLFQEMDVTLPSLTVSLLKISEFTQNHFLSMVLGLLLVIFIGVTAYKESRKVKRATDALLLKLPLSSTFISASTMAFITEYFSLLMKAGIDILQCMTILKESIKNEIYKEKLGEVRESLARGEGIADSFRGVLIFPLFVIRMINVGELSGTLPEQLSYIAEDYRNKLSVLVATIGKMIEPIVLVVAGAMFAIIIAGLFLPVYDLVSQVSGG